MNAPLVKPHPTASNSEWRRRGLGGSDSRVVAGFDSGKTRADLFLEKIGALDPKPAGESAYWGNRLQSIVVEEVCAREGIALDRVAYEPDAQHHPEIEWMFCHPDALVPSKGILIEAKTGHLAWASAWGNEESDDVPDGVLIQVQHNLACMAHLGYRLALVPVLLGGQRFRIYRVGADREIQDWIISEDDEFWKHVVVRQAPPVRTPEEARALYRNAINKPIEATDEVFAFWQAMRAAEIAEKPIDDEIEDAKGKLMAYMGAHDTLLYRGRTLATWKQLKDSKVFDEKRFALENVELYASYCETKSGVRRFLPNRKQQG